jgi:hypothetical protein
MALPKPLLVFFYNHIDFVTQESTVPDLCYCRQNEAPKHYFDMENFGSVDSFPQNMAGSQDMMINSCLKMELPWYIQRNDGKINYSI